MRNFLRAASEVNDDVTCRRGSSVSPLRCALIYLNLRNTIRVTREGEDFTGIIRVLGILTKNTPTGC